MSTLKQREVSSTIDLPCNEATKESRGAEGVKRTLVHAHRRNL
jgi:hypothetical protein